MAVASILAAMVAAGTCGGSDIDQIDGLVIEVKAQTILTLASLTIQDETGRLWTLLTFTQGFVGFTPSHLREHQALGQRVTVLYRDTPDGLIAVRIID